MNFDFDGLTRMAWDQLWQVTIVALGIGAIVKLCCRNQPRVAYALWMLVVIKAIVPPFWSSPAGVFSWALAGRGSAHESFVSVPPTSATSAQGTLPFGEGRAQAKRDIERAATYEPALVVYRLRIAVISIWGTGFALCAAFVLAKQIACSKLIRRSSLAMDERYISALAELSGRLGVKRDVRLIVTSRPFGPAVFGLVRPSILMPAELMSGNPPEQVELILAHELIHVRRGDIVAGKLQLVGQLVWWFHPLVWWANREACRERERCCDAEVVARVGCKPVRYARALMNVLEQKSRLRLLVAIPGVRALDVTSRRLESIMHYGKTDHRRASLISRVVFVTGAVVLIPGTGLTIRADPSLIHKVDGTGATAPGKSTAVTPEQNAPRPESKPTEAPSAKARWRAQQIVARKANVDYQNARLVREIAEIAVLEYEEGTFQQDLATVDGEMKLAKSDLTRCEDRLDWARRMFVKGYIAKTVVNSAELALKKARFTLEQAQAKRFVLVKYTKGKTIKELKSEIEKARSDELAKQEMWEREKAKEAALEREALRERTGTIERP